MLPESLTVKSGSIDVTNYIYNFVSATEADFKISKENIKGNVVITVKLLSRADNVLFTFNGENCTLNNKRIYPKNQEITAHLVTANPSFFAAPNNIAVRINNKIMVAGTDYIYSFVGTGQKEADLTIKKESITGDIAVDALAIEDGLTLELEVTPQENQNKLGFVFQVTQERWNNNDYDILVDWGDGEKTTVKGSASIDTQVAPGGNDQDPRTWKGMFSYVMSKGEGPFPPEGGDGNPDPTFNRHEYKNEAFGKKHTVKIYGSLNNIAFGFPDPDGGDTDKVYPWGTANQNISSITTYADFKAEDIVDAFGESTSKRGNIVIQRSFNTYVIFGATGDSLQNIKFALGTTNVPNGCFLKCKNLHNVTLPDTVTRIGDEAFSNGKVNQITIPDSVTEIGWDAFKNGGGAETKQLMGGISISNNSQLKTIGKNAFFNDAMPEFNLPDATTTIGQNAFGDCANMKKFKIGRNSKLKIIGDTAFQDCAELDYILIPQSVDSIGSSAFLNWTESQKIYFPGLTQEEIDAKFDPKWKTGCNATIVPNQYPPEI